MVDLNFTVDGSTLGIVTFNFVVDALMSIEPVSTSGIGKQIVDFLLAYPNSTGLQIGNGVLNPVSSIRYRNHVIRKYIGFLLRINKIDKVVDNGSTMISVYTA